MAVAIAQKNTQAPMKAGEISIAECALKPEADRIDVLVIEDSSSSLAMLCRLLSRKGYNILGVSNAASGLEKWRQINPRLILTDINLPDFSGIELTKRIRESSGEHWLPIIYVTGTDDPQLLEDGLEAGGDDFITKPVNQIELLARVRASLRQQELYEEQFTARKELVYLREQSEQEQRVARRLYDVLVRPYQLVRPELKYHLSPMSVFNGDLLLASDTPDGGLNLLVGDFTGHGLGSAVGALPAAEIFFAMSEKAFPLHEIVREINSKLLRLLPVELFLAACLIRISPDRTQAEVWNGGIPSPILRRAKAKDLAIFSAKNVPLGIVQTDDLSLETDHLALSADDRMYFYTDGVIEARAQDGQQFGFAELCTAILSPKVGDDVFDLVLHKLELHGANHDQDDDITFLEVNFNSDLRNPAKKLSL